MSFLPAAGNFKRLEAQVELGHADDISTTELTAHFALRLLIHRVGAVEQRRRCCCFKGVPLGSPTFAA